MRRSLSLLVTFLTLAAVAADPPAKPKEGKKPDAPAKPKDEKKPDASQKTDGDAVAPGKDLPGPFHPYNVTGPRKGRFHCLVSEYGQEPVVMVIAHNLDFTDTPKGFKDLLKEVDNAIDKNPAARLKAFVAFQSDDLPNVVTDDESRDKFAKKVEDLAAGLMLKHVVLTLAGKADLEKYAATDTAYVVVLYHKLAVVASERLGPDKLTEAKVKEIMAQVGSKLGATRK
jgi:hypothetical protein